jgi:predicted dienelactone hydrolase
MKRIPLLMVLALIAIKPSHAAQEPARAYKKDAGPAEVTVTRLDWKDEKRNREVPVTIYAPQTNARPAPVILFSHGLGGSRDGYAYLGRHWASHGFVSVHLQHRGSDDAVWKGSKQPLVDMRKATKELANSVNRPLDVRFALDQLTRLNREDTAWKGRLDLDHVGMAGHSFGGWTTQAVVGEVFVTPTGKEVTLAEPRVKAAIIMSPSPAPAKADQGKAFGSIQVPCLHLTGTKDDGVSITEVKPADRRVPFDHIRKADQYLVIFQEGDHMIFSNARLKRENPARDARLLDLIRMSTTAFWDAYLRGDESAKRWLADKGLREALGADGTFEKK